MSMRSVDWWGYVPKRQRKPPAPTQYYSVDWLWVVLGLGVLVGYTLTKLVA